MTSFKPKNIQAKFLIGIGAIVLTIGIFFASGMYFHLSSLLDSQVKGKADLIFNQVGAVQSYVREVLRPEVRAVIAEDEFIIEAMSSSYISRAIMQRVASDDKEYHYRRVAENARNPLFEMNAEESRLLGYFRKHPDEKYWEGYRKLGGVEYFVKARPVVFKKSCLTCHGVSKDAPAVLLSRYGDKRGFGHKENSVGGLVIVGVPVEKAVAGINKTTARYAILYGCVMIFLFVLIQFFFNRLVMGNIRNLSRKFHTLLKDEDKSEVLDKIVHGDEIEEVAQGIEELGEHLHQAQEQLREHSENMEQMVEVRTDELKKEVHERRADVDLFVRLLDGFNKSFTRREMWQFALPLLVQRFNAESATFICMVASHNHFSWPESTPKPALPENWREILTEVKPVFEKNRGFIPVAASENLTEGIFCLVWDESVEISRQDQDVLRAIGQQMGIAMENINALNNLLHQKDVLQAIVEGMGDPVLFVDGNCNIILANEAARILAGSFSGVPSDVECAGLFLEGAVLERCSSESGLKCHDNLPCKIALDDGRSFSVSVFPIEESGEKQGRRVVCIRDITQEKQMLVRMQQSEKLATVGKLAAGLAHEINNPLGVIKCYGELLKDGLANPDVLADLDIILKHASQAQNVLQDLLNFARPRPIELAELDLAGAVANAVGVFRVQAEKNGVQVLYFVDENLPSITTNAQAIEQILANLLNNGLDAVKPGSGVIDISLYSSGEEEVLLRVADNGSGLDRESIGNIFDPFFTTKEVGKGTGLGLAVVYGLVKDLGGRIEVENDNGAVFSVYLPAEKGGQ
ncbi:c-type heme family protein [Maridesulfovibrio hydrothermalis]|uniref:histidine kinase n=1 Tax=Maridesulfovibrio hydrothermalis AM13 = DSM 14728 TaxID=1121451 RepID=L0REZ0_9BACT|nr:DUF3365 domain-containing protein [Maridesulfovibrio hydrothermalis]CCO24121.1 Integral membrane sensor signal transduction histidine kinase [Maridesulfovibrio hydrothermalis AM13 = DSM 14728]